MITTVTLVQRFATKTLYTRARATDGSTMLAPMSPGAGKGLTKHEKRIYRTVHQGDAQQGLPLAGLLDSSRDAGSQQP